MNMAEPSHFFAGDQYVEGTESSTLLSEVLEEIKSKLPPESRDLQELKDALPNATSLTVRVSGRAGTGKSCLVNGILGKSVAKEDANLIGHAETPNLVSYSRNIGGVKVTVWDTPGLQDRSHDQVQDQCIGEMQERCSTVDLTLYCIKMIEKRFPRGRSDNPDVNAMARLTDAFGPEFWRNTIVVLTFANVVEAVNVGWRKLDASAKAAAFQKELERWRSIIQDILISEIHVPQEIAMSVIVAPAGHYDDRQLLDRDYWLSKLWFHCLEVIATPEGRAALVRINALRIRHKSKVTEADFEQCLEDQPIVVEGNVPKKTSWPSVDIPVGPGAGTGAGSVDIPVGPGAGTGAVIGAVLGGFGTLGVGIGTRIGAFIGAQIGFAVAFVVAYVRTAINYIRGVWQL